MANDIINKLTLSDSEKKAFDFLGDDVLGCLSESAVIIGDARSIVFNIIKRLEKHAAGNVSLIEIQKTQSELRALHGYLEANWNWVVDVSAEYENKHLLQIMDLYETLD